jgi:hypothetical protein
MHHTITVEVLVSLKYLLSGGTTLTKEGLIAVSLYLSSVLVIFFSSVNPLVKGEEEILVDL